MLTRAEKNQGSGKLELLETQQIEVAGNQTGVTGNHSSVVRVLAV